jgi:hypothetical protein
MTKLVSTLIGAELALWVAKADGLHITCDTWQGAGCTYVLPALEEGGPMFEFEPQIDWSQGGPLIEKHRIELEAVYETRGYGVRTGLKYWFARHPKNYGGLIRYSASGPTPLIAAMRALVASVYGKEVPNEENT